MKDQNKSQRHHYIPRFLINQFADSDGLLYVYNKEKGYFLDTKRSSKSVFYEMNRNTILMPDGSKSDYLEQLYSDIDNKISDAVIRLIRDKDYSVEIFTEILILASILKWRIPDIDEEFAKQENQISFEQLPIEIIIKNDDGTNNESALKHLLSSDLFKETKRVIYPFLPFYKGKGLTEEKSVELIRNCFVHENPNTISILGDNPLIENQSADPNNFGRFIFPLSNNVTFCYSDAGKTKIGNPKVFYLNKDLAMFDQAKDYVVCSDKKYLMGIIELHKLMVASGVSNQIRTQIFNFFQ